ncbi:hypothetical protein AF72_11390 [Xylella taiwanensis]|uniref:Uncharacterized protein n=1 Tax=Xylella taiwanensis TaxID=1444770 RepID=Z9JGQ3_9GAMM|nr:hypothetical protein AB672_00600 [Xylella taiwanensis]EWS77364.1 hypothetical protein AF72_11390 [Xylella taiwanensis]
MRDAEQQGGGWSGIRMDMGGFAAGGACMVEHQVRIDENVKRIAGSSANTESSLCTLIVVDSLMLLVLK